MTIFAKSFGAASAPINLAVVASLLSVAACSKPPQRQVRAPISVLTVPVRRADVPYSIEANGTVTPMSNANVAAQVDGIVTDVLFQEGQEVTKGQVLFHIDPRPYQNAYQQARAALARDLATWENAQHEYERYVPLLAARVATEEETEAKRATAASLKATLLADSALVATAKFNLDNTTVKAPIAGRTGSLLVKPGNLARAAGGSPLVVINQVRPILVRFAVPASQLPLILQYGAKGGLPVTVAPSTTTASAPPPGKANPELDASTAANPPSTPVPAGHDNPDQPTVGALSFIDNAVDTTTGTVQLKAKFDNTSGMLWAGQFVSASLRLFVEDSALVVPTQCVVTGQRGTYVYVIDSANTAQQRPVTVERATGGISVIASGLAAGERVVTDGQSRLTPGAVVDLRSSLEGGGGVGGGRGGRGGRNGGGRGRGGAGRGTNGSAP